MKIVSAAKLRRAQERAMLARPYARMISNVLESLVRRTGDSLDVTHPLLVEREEKNVLVIVVAGDKGFAGAFNSNIVKAAQNFINGRRAQGQNIDRAGRPAKARHLPPGAPAAVYEKEGRAPTTTISPLHWNPSAIVPSRSRLPATIPRSCSRSPSTK